MHECTRMKDLERWFDGEAAGEAEVETHLAGCAACRAHLESLQMLRSAANRRATRIEITDAQFESFANPIRERIENTPRSYRGFWAAVSTLCAAALIVVAVLVGVSGSPNPVEAESVVESFTTEIDGATATSFVSGDGTATVWVNVPDGDMW